MKMLFTMSFILFIVWLIFTPFIIAMNDMKKIKKEIFSRYEYVEISPFSAIASIHSGVEFNRETHYCGNMWYFIRHNKKSFSVYSGERVYVNWNYFDRKRFEYMYKKYVDEKENEKVMNNHSEDGYNYLIQAVEEHRNDCVKEAQQSVNDATEVYVNSYKNLYNSVKY